MLHIASLGYPSSGMADAIELWRAGAIDDWRLGRMARAARQAGWSAQKAAGITQIPSGDFGFGDPVADTAAIVGAVPANYGPDIGRVTLDVRLALAGQSEGAAPERAVWQKTHKSFVSPLLRDDDRWRLNSAHPVAEQLEARSFGITTRPVLLGPISFLLQCRTADGGSPLAYLDRILPAYQQTLSALEIHGARWVQLDEPALAGCEDETVLQEFARAYEQLRIANAGPKLMVVTYGGDVTAALPVLEAAPVEGLHIDLVSAPNQLTAVAAVWPASRTLSIGVVDTVNPAPTDLRAALQVTQAAIEAVGPTRLQVAPSLPLSFAPTALDRAPLDQVPAIETAADKLAALRRIADAAIMETDLPANDAALPVRRDLEPQALAG